MLAETGVAWAAWMGPLTITAARHLACDAQVSTVILDDHGAPLDVGLTSRTATGKQRRALAVRDGGCAFPGCGAPASWCEAHHAGHWVDGGLTDMDNLVLLCGFHHRLIHHDGWEVQMGADRHPWFIPPPSVDPFRQPLPPTTGGSARPRPDRHSAATQLHHPQTPRIRAPPTRMRGTRRVKTPP
ncbi:MULTISPECIES: DUF222 domain-containing protein [unclassified Rhodococcus (in: high G+C Gram-positive bacteria)]|uniref:HNH endonuclease signature motif containing protein n=1 Tax=unclassified Rhodococcus (in: high G+C Gram-positive bacteria) TaxID=192944 RepID=UPI0037C7DB3F